MATATEERAKAARRELRGYVQSIKAGFDADPASSDYQRGYFAAMMEVGSRFKIGEPDEGCLGKAADDEPVFVLRAQDRSAAGLVDLWASANEMAGSPHDKTTEAHELAAKMRAWPTQKLPD